MEYFLFGALTFIFILGMISIGHINDEIKRTNKLLEKIANHIGAVDTPKPPIDDEKFNLYISKHDKIRAIKRYRELTGEGLREAKDYVDSLFK
ncbi:ribosomal protein L7/L12 [Clostridium intestinale]|uniref:ribosomal protein L7/L12 n=1 Tax=Clostridium intestinale TaxID=36845 RepID=UPI002DD69672|nr:ribosomal protein L7/L12 [Clostridium intestinale]WRY53166.1 ribosomal protein L7/L12 [Clostridium intestinale]